MTPRLRTELLGTELLALAAAALLCTPAAAQDPALLGRWRDPADPAQRLGALVVEPQAVRMGRALVYAGQWSDAVGDKAVFKVEGVKGRAKSPTCGPRALPTYLIFDRRPPNDIGRIFVRVTFYSSADAPTAETLQNGYWACITHPFEREK